MHFPIQKILQRLSGFTAIFFALSASLSAGMPSAIKPPPKISGAPEPYGATPTEQQVQWQRLEYYGFVHFGLNTFTGNEWGYGNEEPRIFDPKNFDADAIVKTFKDAGMTGLIYTAKHHDGFCMWQTKTTEHCIKESPWKNGRGDVVKELSAACKKRGLKFGVYLSPWDRNHAEYGRAAYLKTYYKQIEELLTRYGAIFEIWFDGANGGDGFYGGAREHRNIGDAEKYYDFQHIVKMIRALQPDCIVWGAGHYGDARWGGSERGFVNYPHWHTLDSKRGGDGGTGFRGGDRWVPAEGDTTINRAGWFWHPGQNSRVKPPQELMTVWFESVGRGANLILNVAPNRAGELDPADVKSLLAFKKMRDALYREDFARGAKKFKASSERGAHFSAKNLTDGNADSYWAARDSDKSPSVEIVLPKKSTFDVVRVREEIRLGQRVEAWALDAWLDGAWREVVSGSSIGNQAMLRFPGGKVSTDRVRLRIEKSPAVPCIAELSLFAFPDFAETESASAAVSGIKKEKWKIISEPENSNAKNAIDGNAATFWHTHLRSELPPPQSFTVDMGETISVKAFTYLPRQDGTAHGMTDRYIFELSLDGKTWTKVAEGEFGNLRANPVEQIVDFKPRKARFFRFTGTHALEKNHVSAAEIGILAE